jgi:molybdopterin converting factor small subunit
MTVTMRLWAGVKEAAGTDAVAVEAATIAEARDALAGKVPALAGRLRTCRFALDDAFVPVETRVPAGATVDVIPPVSGG